MPPVGRKGVGADRPVPLEGDLAAAGLGVPEPEGVAAPRADAPPVGGKGAGVDLDAVPLEGHLAATRLCVPELEGLVPAPRDDAPPAGREGAGADRFVVPHEGADQRLGLSLSRAQVDPGEAARRAAPGRLVRDALGGFAPGDVPLQPVVQLLKDEGGEAREVGRQQVVQLAGVVAREGPEYLALIASGHNAPHRTSTPVSYTHLTLPTKRIV